MKQWIGVAMSATVLATAAWAFSPRPLPAFAATALHPDQLQINGLAHAGSRLVAAGERGKLLLSDDQGASWRTAVVGKDQGSTLTQLAFADDKKGIAVGHSGWILRTEDGGEHWQQTAFDDKQSDPLLGVWMQPGGAWFAFGSFGRFLESRDQGASWKDAGLRPLGRYRGMAVAGCAPDEMGIGPVFAVPKLLKKAGLKVEDIGLWELNEAFAVQVLYCADKLGIPMDRLNVNGGAIAVGHPYGVSGARLVGRHRRPVQRRADHAPLQQGLPR